ncbi:hypothetical protein V1520DRAFT_18064 [Lipomyces starkeyi]|uniref:Uncharacterized protein n=1 Tax=Lipomyces starkeyi NRRL Y-11557 TaxID=675824 RepID=A0A1E3PY36_LIPST|nr:hypothetical protein LIPSTDRAFT_165324 [Lipomyces starkeyi NRRL Y-11557]
MRIIRAGLFLLTLSFCIVSICAAHLSFNLFTDGTGTTPSSSSSSRAAAAAAGISQSTSSSPSSISSSVLSLSYATLSTISASIVALLYSTQLFSSQLDGILIKFPGASKTQSDSCCSARRKHIASILSCTCPDSADDDSVDAVADVSDDSTDGKSACSIGDDFMSCRVPPKKRIKSKAATVEEPITPEQELFKALAEGEYANNLCALEGSVDCSVNSACFQLGLCTSPTMRPAPTSPHPGLQLYKPPIVLLPTPPQSTHLLSSLLGPSSKTTLLLRAFAKSIYKFNNISVMSSVSTDTGEASPGKNERPTPISTFTVVSPPTGTASGLLEETEAEEDEEEEEEEEEEKNKKSNEYILQRRRKEEVEDTATNEEKADFVRFLPTSIPAESIPELVEQETQAQSPAESRSDPQHQPQCASQSNKSTGIATNLNMREVLAASNRGSCSCLGLVIAMLCFVGMGM